MGNPSYENRAAQLGAGAGFRKGSSSFGGSLGFGRHSGAFGMVGVDVNVYDDEVDDLQINESSVSFGAGAGYQVPLGTTGRAQLCPIVQAGYEYGPNDVANQDIDFNTGGVALGLRLGGEVAMSPTLSFVPWGGASVVYQRARIQAPGFRDTASDTYGGLSFGASLIVNRRLSFGPSVEIPLGLEDADPVFGVRMSVGLGGR